MSKYPSARQTQNWPPRRRRSEHLRKKFSSCVNSRKPDRQCTDKLPTSATMFTGAVGFDVSIADPKERIQKYIDQWKAATEYNVRSEILMALKDIALSSGAGFVERTSTSGGCGCGQRGVTLGETASAVLTAEDACGAGVRPQGSSLRQPAVKQEPRPATTGIPVPQGGD